MKIISVSAVFAALLAVAVAQETTGEGIITIDPISASPSPSPTDVSTTIQTTTESATVPTTTTIITSATRTSVITVTTTSGTPIATPKPSNAGNALNAPVRGVIALGGGAALLAQFL
ncbi:hypothetical protein BGZ51_004695 [Haplosporangium sp. Z 767]|nr:hypothetical protein BGZ51_004695 [Haplosporangium sp. Z 767]KAF9182898.1 hypothetical protein BGZ50_004630 [Haplosporangium sp. Z 11]